MPGLDAYKPAPSASGNITSPYSATVYLPGHVDPPSAGPLPEASWKNGLLSAWHPNTTGDKVSIPVKQPGETVQVNGRPMTKPGKLEAFDLSVDRSYQIRAVGMDAVDSQQMVTPQGQRVTRVNYEYQYEVREGTNVIFNEINFPSDSEWKRVSTENVADLVRNNGVASANLPGREGK
ncbi:hypothetical protein [Streptomyces daqingensis]|uniref:hypothetical protein n=1 Tax=Streptomyces daqingensis TaxID=1472640 RepID=UPI0016631768|nr:hypothetical protein [Streptomyces daqingensis]